MIDAPKILKTTAQTTAVIHITVPRSEIQKVMGPGLAEVRETITAQGIVPVGPWFTHHLKMDSKVFDFEVGVPVDKLVTPKGRVKPGELPAATVARTVYHGPYEGLYSAWAEFGTWIVAQGHKTGPSLWETYLTDPNANPDPSTYLTELTQPLLK
jgi:effector-binding domain-containing protein